MSHFIKYCVSCQKVIEQCRCPSVPGNPKSVEYGVCPECLAKSGSTTSEHELLSEIKIRANKSVVEALEKLLGEIRLDVYKVESLAVRDYVLNHIEGQFKEAIKLWAKA